VRRDDERPGPDGDDGESEPGGDGEYRGGRAGPALRRQPQADEAEDGDRHDRGHQQPRPVPGERVRSLRGRRDRQQDQSDAQDDETDHLHPAQPHPERRGQGGSHADAARYDRLHDEQGQMVKGDHTGDEADEIQADAGDVPALHEDREEPGQRAA